MKHYLCIFIVGILFCLSPAFASAFTVSGDITISGEKDTYFIKEITVTNDVNHSVNFTLTPSSNLQDSVALPYLEDLSFSIPANSSKKVEIVFLVKKTVDGYITVSGEGVDKNILVSIEKTTASANQSTMQGYTIFPSEPIAGKSMAIISNDKINKSGFVMCSESGNMYNVVFADSNLVIVNLEDDDIGEALLWIDGHTQSFNITSGIPEELILRFSKSNYTVNDKAEVTLLSGDRPLKQVNIMVTKPDKQTFNYTTDVLGKIIVDLDKDGKWKFNSEYKSKTVEKEIQVKPLVLSLSVLTNKPTVNDYVEISSEEGAVLKIYPQDNPNDIRQYTVASTVVGFYPSCAGTWIVEGEKNGATAVKQFTVYTTPHIQIWDTETNKMVFQMQTGKKYQVKLVDDNGFLVKNIPSISVVTPSSIIPLELSSGKAIYKPTQKGTYSFSLDAPRGCYLPTEMTLRVVEGGVDWVVPILIISLVSAILVYLYKSGVLSSFRLPLPSLKSFSSSQPSKKPFFDRGEDFDI